MDCHAGELIIADPIAEQVVVLEQHGGLEQLDQAVDQKRERSRIGREIEAVAMGLEVRKRDRRKHQDEAAGEHDLRRKVALDPDVLLVERDLGEDLVLVARPVAKHDEDGEDPGRNGGETPRPRRQRAANAKPEKTLTTTVGRSAGSAMRVPTSHEPTCTSARSSHRRLLMTPSQWSACRAHAGL